MKINRYIVGVILIITLGLGQLVLAASPEDPLVKIGDLTRVEGLDENQLSGYGLVTGLNGTGDSRFSPTVDMLRNLLNNNGIVTDDQISAKNVAAVTVQATLPPYARVGDRIDVTVASIGDAKSLQGGILLLTALEAPNGQIFASADGPLSVGGFGASGGGSSVQQNHLQVARLPNGGVIQRTLEPDFTNMKELNLLLNRANPETALFITQAINDHFRFVTNDTTLAQAVNSGRINVQIPLAYQQNVVGFLAQINDLQIRASMPATIVINERTGTIVMGHKVRISTVAVAHGNLTVTVSTQVDSLANTDDQGNTDVYTQQQTNINVREETNQLLKLETGATIGDVVKALNAIGASPRDIIAILQAMKEAGALFAEFKMI